MSHEKKPPIVLVPGADPKTDPNLKPQAKKYGAGIGERMNAVRAERPKMGNLAQANEAFKPGRDGPMTIGQITQAQRNAEAGPGGGLSQQTIAGMKAVAEASQKAQAQKAAANPPPKEKPKMEEPKPAAAPPPQSPPTEKEKAKIAESLDTIDDFEIERLMRGIQNDVINNTKERDHVNDPENKRLSEIDFEKGLAEGEFEQIVDVIKREGATPLKVHYRTTTPMENQAVRLWIFKRVTEDPRLDRVSGEMYGLALIVLATTQIGRTKFPDHLNRGEGIGTYSANFDEEAFAKKFDQFMRMPLPVIHAVGTHAQWFDLRVRRMFTSDYAKNG